MIQLAEEMVSDVRVEIQPLLEAHWEEIAHYHDIPLEPDWGFYLAHPGVRVYTARDAGRLVGYAVFFVMKNRHYMSSLQALQDILFVLPQYRGGMVGPRLIRYCDEQLQSEGVQAVYQHVKAAHDFGPLLLRMGYEVIDVIYGKRLDKDLHHGHDRDIPG